MTSCSVALEEDIPCGVLLQGDGGFKDGEAHIMSRQSGRGTVDQESGSAGEMGLDTGRGDQQYIMDKAHITEVQKSACPWVHE